MYQTKYCDTNFITPYRYINVSPIGLGAYGLVMGAKDENTGEGVAIKKLTRSFANPEHAKRAYREFVILNLVNHKNIIKLLNAYTPQQNVEEFSDVYLVTELMQGNLAAFDRTRLDRERLSFLMYQMLCGVHHLHKSGIIHRDLKPQNIGFYNKVEIKILDFGLACSTNSALRTEYVTTRYYRAPEVLLGMNYSAAVDVWSLGCIFAELILNKILFLGKDPIDQWQKVIAVVGTPTPEFCEELLPTIKRYVTFIDRCSPQSWKSVLPDSSYPESSNPQDQELTAECARDLISKMLVIDPRERISVRDAINHPYVRIWFSSEEVDGPPSPPYDGSIDHIQHSVGDWKNAIFNQIQHYSLAQH